MLTRIAALITAATFVLCAVPRAVRADTPAAAATGMPVTMQGCSVDGKWGALDVNFTNAASQEVTKVHFAISDASGVLEMADDVGSYAPGDVVHHRLRVDPILLEIPVDLHCTPASVTFKDGTSWQNPAMPSQMEQALAQTAGSQIAMSRCFIGDPGDSLDKHRQARRDRGRLGFAPARRDGLRGHR